MKCIFWSKLFLKNLPKTCPLTTIFKQIYQEDNKKDLDLKVLEVELKKLKACLALQTYQH